MIVELFNKTTELVLSGEIFLMSILDFDLSSYTPHKVLNWYMQQVPGFRSNDALKQAVRNFMNDG